MRKGSARHGDSSAEEFIPQKIFGGPTWATNFKPVFLAAQRPQTTTMCEAASTTRALLPWASPKRKYKKCRKKRGKVSARRPGPSESQPRVSTAALRGSFSAASTKKFKEGSRIVGSATRALTLSTRERGRTFAGSKLANSRHVEGLVLDTAARLFRGPRRSLLRRHVGGLGRVLLALLLLLLLPQGHVDKDDLREVQEFVAGDHPILVHVEQVQKFVDMLLPHLER